MLSPAKVVILATLAALAHASANSDGTGTCVNDETSFLQAMQVVKPGTQRIQVEDAHPPALAPAPAPAPGSLVQGEVEGSQRIQGESDVHDDDDDDDAGEDENEFFKCRQRKCNNHRCGHLGLTLIGGTTREYPAVNYQPGAEQEHPFSFSGEKGIINLDLDPSTQAIEDQGHGNPVGTGMRYSARSHWSKVSTEETKNLGEGWAETLFGANPPKNYCYESYTCMFGAGTSYRWGYGWGGSTNCRSTADGKGREFFADSPGKPTLGPGCPYPSEANFVRLRLKDTKKDGKQDPDAVCRSCYEVTYPEIGTRQPGFWEKRQHMGDGHK